MAGARAVPPAKLSYHTQFVHGVERAERGFAASVRLRRPGDEAAVYIEFLGARHNREWFAAVCHDLAVCKRAFDGGGLQALQALQHGPARGPHAADADRLNFPLSCYTSQEAFWDALEKSRFGQLVRQMLSSNALEKTLFYGNTWREGLAQQRARDLRSQAHQQRQAATASTADSSRTARAREAAESRREAPEAAEAAGSAAKGRRGGPRERAPPSPTEEHQARRRVREPSPEGAPQPNPATAAHASSRRPPAEPQLDGKPAAAPAVATANGAGSGAPLDESGEPLPSKPPPRSAEEAPAQAQQAGKPAAAAGPSNSGEDEPAVAQRGGKAAAVVVSSSSDEDEPASAQRGSKPSAVVVSSSSSEEELQSAPRGDEAAAVVISLGSGEDEPALAQRAGKPPASARVVSSSGDSELAAPGLARAAGGDGSGQQQPPPTQQHPPPPQQQQPSEQQERPAREPTNVWLKGSAEFPPGSGKYAMYLKAGPLEKSYYTVNKHASEALFPRGYEGEIVLKDAASGRTWTVSTSLKGGRDRYFTRVTQFNRDNAAQPHDVLWLQTEHGSGQQRPPVILFGIWRFRSQEAAAFTAKLMGDKPGGKAAAAAPAARQPSPSPPPQQQQLQRQAPSGSAPDLSRKRAREADSDSEEDVPLLARKAARAAAVARAAQELLEESEGS